MINVYSTHKLVQQLRKIITTHALPYVVHEAYPNKEIKFSVNESEPLYIYPTNKELRDISVKLLENQETHLVYVLDGKFELVEKGSLYDERIIEEKETVDELKEFIDALDEDSELDDKFMTGEQIRLVSIDVNEPEVENTHDDAIEAPDDTFGLPDEPLVDENNATDAEAPEADVNVPDLTEENVVDETKSYKSATQPKKDNFYPNNRNKKRNRNN
jgi:hypothetical protein